jgi:ABC-type polar amino acid transport system ATPase subunit
VKWFGAFQALKDVDLAVGRGEKGVVCGPSGSGKWTLIRLASRLEAHQSRRVIAAAIDAFEAA